MRLVATIDELLHKRTALSQHLINVPVRFLHRVEYDRDIGLRNLLVKKIAHRVHKNHPRPLPFERLQEPFGAKRQVKTGFERVPFHAANPL